MTTIAPTKDTQAQTGKGSGNPQCPGCRRCKNPDVSHVPSVSPRMPGHTPGLQSLPPLRFRRRPHGRCRRRPLRQIFRHARQQPLSQRQLRDPQGPSQLEVEWRLSDERIIPTGPSIQTKTLAKLYPEYNDQQPRQATRPDA